MTDSKRYYWLKLKKDFFQQHQIKVLKALPNGRLYALIYLELMAESTSHEGELRYSKLLPYDTVTLASVIDEDKDNVEKAIETLCKLELVEILYDGTIFMNEVYKMLGSETGSAQRKREYRERIGTMSQECPIEIRDKSIEQRDKNIKARFTRPTLEEIQAYCKERNNSVDAQRFYDYYSANGWVQGKGKPIKDWKACVRLWERNAKPTEDKLPTYDSSNNRSMSMEDEEELMKLMGRR